VYGIGDEKLGEIDDVIFDSDNGQMQNTTGTKADLDSAVAFLLFRSNIHAVQDSRELPGPMDPSRP
jgi:hypothetical protein